MRLQTLASISLLLVSGCCAAEKRNLVELTTKLGLNAKVVVGKVSHPDFLLDRHASGGRRPLSCSTSAPALILAFRSGFSTGWNGGARRTE